jgi:hypothetical protein
MAGPIADRRAALEDLAARLGIGEGIREIEARASINWTGDVAAATLTRVDQAGLDRWFGAFGTELRIACETPEPSLHWKATLEAHEEASLRRFLEDYAQYDSPPIALKVDIDKSRPERFVPNLAAAGPIRVVLFYSAKRLGEILSEAEERDFEINFLGIPEGERAITDLRLLILVADAPGALKGPYLAILGNDHHTGIESELGSAPSFDSIVAARRLTREMSNREDAPRVLTPDFFALREEQALGDCRRALVHLRNRLAISALANRTFKEVEADAVGETTVSWTSVFAGTRVVEVQLAGLAPAGEPRPAETKAPSGPLLLYAWVHEEEKAARTKLEIVRRVTASQLLPKSAGNFDVFVAQSERILADSIVQLNVLIEGNIISSFERQEKLEESVRKYTREVGSRIAALGKEVIDNTYRTVGLLVGVAIAYLLRPDQGRTLVIVAILLYELYVFFVRWFYIGAVNREFASESQAFDDRWRETEPLRKFFDGELVQRFESEVREKNREFSRRSRFVHWLYNAFLVAGLAVLLMLLIAHERQGAEAVRGRLLGRQADVFANLGYHDIRAGTRGRRPPSPLTIAGRRVTPDLTAVRDDPGRTPVFVELVSCSKIEDHRQLEILRLLKAAADQQGAELQVLTEAECQQAGVDRAREWLASEKLGTLRVWAW